MLPFWKATFVIREANGVLIERNIVVRAEVVREALLLAAGRFMPKATDKLITVQVEGPLSSDPTGFIDGGAHADG